MPVKTILFHIPEALGKSFKAKLAANGVTLREWGNYAVESYVNNIGKPKPNSTTKPKKS